MKINPVRNFMFIISGIFIVLSYTWIRYLRERLPLDIPFDFTVINIMFLLFTCGLYTYLIKILIKPSNQLIIKLYATFPKLYEKAIRYSSYFYGSLDALDNVIKENNLIKPIYLKYMRFFILLCKKVLTTENRVHFFIIMTYIIPQGALLIALLLDIYNLQLKWFYMVLPVSLISIWHIYLIFSFKKYKIERLAFLNSKYAKLFTDARLPIFTDEEGLADLEVFIKIQASQLAGYTTEPYYCQPAAYRPDTFKHYREKHNIPEGQHLITEDFNKVDKDFYLFMPILVYLTLFLEEFYIWGLNIKLLKNIKIIINSLFLSCWLYILIISLLDMKSFL